MESAFAASGKETMVYCVSHNPHVQPEIYFYAWVQFELSVASCLCIGCGFHYHHVYAKVEGKLCGVPFCRDDIAFVPDNPCL